MKTIVRYALVTLIVILTLPIWFLIFLCALILSPFLFLTNVIIENDFDKRFFKYFRVKFKRGFKK